MTKPVDTSDVGDLLLETANYLKDCLDDGLPIYESKWLGALMDVHRAKTHSRRHFREGLLAPRLHDGFAGRAEMDGGSRGPAMSETMQKGEAAALATFGRVQSTMTMRGAELRVTLKGDEVTAVAELLQAAQAWSVPRVEIDIGDDGGAAVVDRLLKAIADCESLGLILRKRFTE